MEEIKLHQFAEKLEIHGYSRRCVVDIPWNVRQFFRYLENKEEVHSLDEITPDHITAYHTHLQYTPFRKGRHLATATVVKRLEAVKVFYRVMFGEGLVQQDYGPLVVKPKKRRSLPRHVPTEKDMIVLLEVIRPTEPLTIRDRALLEMLYATGMRNEEIRTLTVDSVDLAERTVFVHGKGGKDRIVPLGDWVLPYLLEYLEASRPKLLSPREPSMCLFVTKNGRQITFGNLGDIVKRYAKKAALQIPVTPHSFRHACATHLLKAGADIRYVQELLGHADLSSTQIYTKVDISTLKEAHKRFHPRERAADGN